MNRVLRAPHARLPLVWLVAIVVAIVAARQEPSMQVPAVDVPVAVTQAIAANGSARVIVGVRGTFVPEGYLADQAAVADQRAAMHGAVEGVMGRAAAAGALLGQRFETIPFFIAEVNGAALTALAAMPDVISISHDGLDRPLLAQSAPRVNAPAAWAAGATGTGWTVVVMDTGVEKTHSFFGGRVSSEACYSNAGGGGTSQGGTSLCPGGVTSSVAVGSGVACSSSIDGCDHGTHVAGIAAGANGTGGINGIAPGASIVAMQIFTRFVNIDLCGDSAPCVLTYNSDQILGLERTLLLAGAGNANRIASVNMSLGGGGPFGSSCDAAQAPRKAAIDNLLSIGVATVIASGNNGFTSGISAPACISTAIAVGSSTKADGMSSFGNRSNGMIDLLAPGGDNTFAGQINSSVTGNAFGLKQGTSMAAPHVAGAWAVLRQAAPTATVAQVLTALQTTGAVINDPSSGSSYRRINVNGARLALANPGSVPGPPGTPTIGGAGNSVVISWTAPTTGAAPFTYTVIARAGSSGPVVATLNAGAALSVTVPAPNGTYSVSIRANNASGSGPESAPTTFSVPVLPTPPGAPTNLAASVAGNQVTFSWTPPSTGTTTSYVLRASLTPSGPPIVSLPMSAPRTSITVAAPAGTYYVRLSALNGPAAGPVSNEVAVVVAPPSAPTLNPATVVGRQVNLSWTAPPSGNPPTSYRVVAALTSGGAPVATLNVGALSLAVNAPPGTYFVRVRGVNAVGAGALSNEITVVVP